MGQSYRIRTELGITKSINVELNQEFEFLEILSLKLNQQDIYLRACSDYGVIVGRITANNGLGLPNARVSIFIPIESIDESNPIVSSIYPYKSPSDKNEDGYRYNLLPYEKSYSTHAATGTLPTRLDVLTGNTAFEIYDKYYKFTAKTNESGDYMIMGVPLGQQTVVMDLDLSDIGEFSLTPQDLIRMGRATEAQVAGNRFRTSEDLNSLPQIVNLSKVVEISPLWGEPSICQIAINRVDFDLRDEANIDIQPTSVFMGSIYSTPDNYRIRPEYPIGPFTFGGRPRDDFGNLCSLQTGPGQILAIRQTINLDISGNPILEEYKIEQNGNVIDENGAWLIELPMNLDYFVTNEFGEKVLSFDPTIGIPSRAKYRFKIKWEQPSNFSDGVRRPYYLVPNVREYGWDNTIQDPNIANVPIQQKNQLASSYYFGLDWSGYTNGFSAIDSSTKINEMVNCEDTFYQFDYNRVYTVAGLIDQYKSGGRGRFIGIKEIDSNNCEDSVNKFPVNEGFKNFDFLFFIVSLLLQIIQVVSIPLLIIIHFTVFFLNVLLGLKALLLGLFGALAAYHLFYCGLYLTEGIRATIRAIRFQAAAANPNPGVAAVASEEAASEREKARAAFRKSRRECALALRYTLATITLIKLYQAYNGQKIKVLSLPVLRYPDCEGCDCSPTDQGSSSSLTASQAGLLSRFSDPYLYYDKILNTPFVQSYNTDSRDSVALAMSMAVGGTDANQDSRQEYKTMIGTGTIFKDDCALDFLAYSTYLPLGERINLFNTRKKYFDGVNRIKVTFEASANTQYHFDNTLTVFLQSELEPGTLLTFVDPNSSRDPNFLYTGNTSTGGIQSEALNPGPSNYSVQYCDPTNPYSNLTVSPPYRLGAGSTTTGYTVPVDVEYFQVITAMTIAQAITMFQGAPNESLPQIINSGTAVITNNQTYTKVAGVCFTLGWGNVDISPEIPYSTIFEDYAGQYVTILQRGVDPFSPLYKNKYGLGILFGSNNPDSITLTAETRLNIPIQKLNSGTNMSVQPFTQNGQSEIFYPSHFFRGGITNSTTTGQQWSAFTSSIVGYYSNMDATNIPFGTLVSNPSPVNNAVVSSAFNDAYSNAPQTPSQRVGKYNSGKDISGAEFFYVSAGDRPNNTSITYYTGALLPQFEANPMNINQRNLNVMRTDRLPTSDNLDGGSWALNPSILQQNLGFSIYQIEVYGNELVGTGQIGTGADVVTQDIGLQYAEINVLDTLNTCANIVGLDCYVGIGTGFKIDPNCPNYDAVVNGCYQFVRQPLKDIRKDIRNFNEWAYRFRFNYGLCRGVLAQSFTNNWINGSLFMYPIQIDVTFNSQNKPNPPIFQKKLVYYDSNTQNFYFRSSPFISGNTPTEFIGRSTLSDVDALNKRNLLYPTTVINLGMKDFFFKEIIFEPSTNAYIMRNLNSTSYSDNSDIVNLFVISRITNTTFLQRMLGSRDSSINSLFTRNGTNPIFQPKNRVDADLVQMLSINNEIGVIPFSPEFYPFIPTNTNNPVVVLPQNNDNSTIGIYFSSTTEDLQVKDFISPGVIDFRFNPAVTAVTYRYGIKSQKVPFYQWELVPGSSISSIFGSERSNWATNLSDIVTSEYQSLDRRNLNTPNYFVPSITSFDVNQRGYIFNINQNGLYDYNVFPGMKTKILIGAPNQFYFGVVKGGSALDKFKTKYLPNE